MPQTAVKKKVSMIPAKPQYDRSIKLSEKKLRVAAYCRVSTELEEQESSYEAQVEYYTRKIAETDNWKMAGIYADDGKSATNTKKRDDFNAMIKDALDGKIDMILTKSVSRFARNTVDSLLTIRKLKEKNMAVVFEKEGVNTLDGTGEILITILSSLAQEESRNISENTRWGVVRRFENGKMIVNHNKFMGYTKNENGDLVIVPEEAEIVRLIFRLYLEGYSAKKISQYLEENGIKTATGQDKWYDSVIFKMLRNEKYMGDALLQKTYTVDFMTKKKVINKGIVPQYYVEDDHEPIIPKELFYRVQEELARRASMNKSAVTRKKKKNGKHSSKSKFSSEYALTLEVSEEEITQAVEAIKKKYDWKYPSHGREPQLCFYSDTGLLSEDMHAGYEQFCENIGGELARDALKNEYPQLYEYLRANGKAFLVKFKIPFSI